MRFGLKKWDPVRELSTLQSEMEDLFRKLTGGFGLEFAKGQWYPTVESYLEGDKLHVRADLPGMDPADIDVSIAGNMLTIKGERKSERKEKESEYLFCETSYGSFERTITLPEGVDTENVHAEYKGGVLEITMPAKGAALPRKVHVTVAKEEKERKAA